MAVFSDDFERANGALGANWGSQTLFTISGGYAASNQTTWSFNWATTLSDAGKQIARATMGYAHANGLLSAPLVKNSGATNNGYYACIVLDTGVYYLAIRRADTHAVLGSRVSIGSTQPYTWTIQIEYDEGNITATYNDSTTATAFDLTWPGNEYAGIIGYSTTGRIASVQITMGDAATLTVDPDVIGNYGECTELELTGTNTSWTAGTPGSPTFTVDHGTISAQTVNSTTSATITYCPGDYLGAVIFTDPSTGQTDTAIVTSDPEVVPPSDLCPFNQDFIDMANLTPDVASGSLLATGTQITTIDETEDFSDVVSQLWRGLFLGETPVGASESVTEKLENLRKGILGAWEADDTAYVPINEQPVKADTDQTLSFLLAPPNNYVNLADIVALLGGSPTVLSHQDLKTAIDNVSGQIDLSAVLDKLDSIQGSQLISITDLAGQLQGIRTIAGYSLGDVLAAIGALNPATAPGLAAALATIMGSLGALALEIAAIGVAETEDAAASSAGAASAAGALAWLLANGPTILDLLQGLQDALGASGNAAPHPPVWPGLANVDLGAPVDLASTNALAGPMHGVLLDITSADPGTNRYLYDTVPAWKNIGALSFFTDTGHHETYQALSFAQALYVPKSMAVAGGVRVFHGRGPQGTIRPWSYKA